MRPVELTVVTAERIDRRHCEVEKQYFFTATFLRCLRCDELSFGLQYVHDPERMKLTHFIKLPRSITSMDYNHMHAFGLIRT